MSRTIPEVVIPEKVIHLRHVAAVYDAADGQDEKLTGIVATYSDGSHVNIPRESLDEEVGQTGATWRQAFNKIRTDLQTRPLS